MSQQKGLTLCMLGCGNLGLAILQSIVHSPLNDLSFERFLVCVRSRDTEDQLKERFHSNAAVTILRGRNGDAVQAATVIILAVDPADVTVTLWEPGVPEALRNKNKLLISVAAGYRASQLGELLVKGLDRDPDGGEWAWIIRALPNIAAQVSQSQTAIETPSPAAPRWCLEYAHGIFAKIGTTILVPSHLMDAATAVCGSTPAFFAVICDALIDAAVAVGVPRPMASEMISRTMLGTATMMQSGVHPALLRDQGTSPEGCTIGGLMVMEEAGVRGHVGRALRESVTIARQMGRGEHVNDTRK